MEDNFANNYGNPQYDKDAMSNTVRVMQHDQEDFNDLGGMAELAPHLSLRMIHCTKQRIPLHCAANESQKFRGYVMKILNHHCIKKGSNEASLIKSTFR